MTRLSWALALFSWVIFLPAERAIANSSPLSLEFKEALRFALEHSPILNSAEKNQQVRDFEFRTSRAKMLPSLDFSGSHGLKNNIPVGGASAFLAPNPSEPWYSALSLGISETFYDNGFSYIQSKVAGLSKTISELTYLKTRDMLLLQVSQAFYQFSLATALLETRKQQQTALNQQFGTLKNQYHQGFTTKSDFLRFKAQIQRAEIERVSAQNAIETSLADLKQLLGVGLERYPIRFVPLPTKRGHKIQSMIPAQAPRLTGVYDFKIAEIQKQVNSSEVSLVQREYSPRFYFTSDVTYSNLDYLNPATTTALGATEEVSWNAVLKIDYNLWDWGIRKRNVQVAELQNEMKRNEIQQTLLETQSDIDRLMADLAKLTLNCNLNEELLDLEEESNNNLRVQYREGKVAYLDLITGLNSLLDARMQFYSSYYEALQGIAKYRYYEGGIYEALL